MQTHTATVLGRRRLSAHLVTITLGGLTDLTSTQIPDEYVRLLIPPPGAELALPQISPEWKMTYPDGAVEPASRVYTISDYRVVDGVAQIDIDVALHDDGIGSQWASTCAPGDVVGVIDPHGLYAAPRLVGWQYLVCDITGLPAMARILRGLEPEQTAEAVVVLTDPADEIALPSAADVTIDWRIVEHVGDISGALTDAVTSRTYPETDRYVWFAGEARANRAARRHLRRELGWSQEEFYTCGYWQVDAQVWNARFDQVRAEVLDRARAAQEAAGDDQGAYLDALEEIYDSVGL